MKNVRRLIAAVAAAALPALVHAQAFPTKQINIVVPYAPGGQTDILARLIGAEMQRIAGQNVIVENRPGGGGVIATEAVVKAGADGHTACFCTPTIIYLPGIQDPQTQYDPAKVLVPVVQLFDAAALFVARPGFKAANLRDALAMAKANPGQVSFGSIGTGNRATYPVQLLISMTGTSFNNVSYKGEQPIVTDLLGDRIDLGYVSIPSAVPQIRAGKLKPIAAIAPSRLVSLPDLPTVSEVVPGYEATVYFGLFVPTGTPRGAIDRLNEIGATALNAANVQERLRAESLFPIGGKPEAFAARVRADGEKWNRLMK